MPFLQQCKKRIKKYYERESKIIFPPVELTNSNNENSNREYFLIVSRLVAYKRVDLAIEAFNQLDLPLKIVGVGRQLSKLKALARDNVEFVGALTDTQLVDYYGSAKALVFPQEEDFGLTAVEAQAHGAPVIAYRGGGALDTVNNKTGIFFGKQTVGSLVKAVKRFEKTSFDKKEIVKNAKKFSSDRFKKEFLRLVSDVK